MLPVIRSKLVAATTGSRKTNGTEQITVSGEHASLRLPWSQTPTGAIGASHDERGRRIADRANDMTCGSFRAYGGPAFFAGVAAWNTG